MGRPTRYFGFLVRSAATGFPDLVRSRARDAESRPRRTGSDLLFQMVAGVGFEPTTFGL